ncbi:hypothetical protein V6N11_048083 [Hibiscus sabdariffa]|uniref:Uncharacterized protein n=1 Tax=Hibiscus sabdariffa TaxID=183260 RepID=A0ABR2NRU0_9ROSI
MPQTTTPGAHATAFAPKPPAKTTTSARRTLTRKDTGKAPIKPTPPAQAPEETIKLDSEEDEDMPDAPSQPAPTFDTFVPRRRFKRKANRNINIADLAVAAEAGSEDTEDNGSSTTPEATPMVSPPQSKARYKRVATKTTPK